jgi:hypothetical protein
MKIINLYETYKKVKQRVKRSSGCQLELAKSASAAAKNIVENPTIKNVEIFRKIEIKWIKLSKKIRLQLLMNSNMLLLLEILRLKNLTTHIKLAGLQRVVFCIVFHQLTILV